MNKQDLIGKVAEITGMAKGDSEKAVNAVFDQITDVLKARGEVRFCLLYTSPSPRDR